MDDAVMISIQPCWWKMIAQGFKTLEIRKSKPKLATPFRAYIYCTMPKQGEAAEVLESKAHYIERIGCGKVVGEFVCDRIEPIDVPYPAFRDQLDPLIMHQSCVPYYALHRYAYHDTVYGWYISGLKVYDKPRELGEFASGSSRLEYTDDGRHIRWSGMKRPPQSWCYVEERRG